MPIYKVANGQIVPVERTTFSQQGLRERQNLQEMLKTQVNPHHIAYSRPRLPLIPDDLEASSASRRQTLPASTGHSHSIINKPFLLFNINDLFFSQLIIP